VPLSTLAIRLLTGGSIVEFHTHKPTIPDHHFQVPYVPITSREAPLPSSGRRVVTPPEADNDTRRTVDDFTADLQRPFTTYLAENVQLPFWEPQQASDEIRKHVASLRIPALASSSPSPSLLLHNLGKASLDEKVAELLDRLFRRGSLQK
jgi:hypothetical protein